MSRSGYIDSDGGYDEHETLRIYGWQANVRRCIAGRKGQALMWELYLALEALPERALVTGALVDLTGSYCALGALAKYRGLTIPDHLKETEEGEPDEYEFQDAMGPMFGIKDMLAREVMYINDECERLHEVPGPSPRGYYGHPQRWENDQERWQRMRRWVVSQLKDIP